LTADVDPLDLVDPGRFAQRGYPHDVWTRLRAEAPVARFEPEGFAPFWAITKHADVVEISRQPEVFSSARGITLDPAGVPVVSMPDMVVMLDPPRHGPMRKVANRRLTRKAVAEQRPDVERISTGVLDRAATDGPEEADFVERIAAPLPLGVIAWLLGVPDDDWGLLFRWTNEVIGSHDPEFRREGETPGRAIKRARGEIHAYFDRLIEQRRRAPADDLVSELLAGRVDGEPLNHEQLVSYCELLVEAGNETTRNAISGGLLAFCDFPGEWEKLLAHPELLPQATDEILRWITPIIYFKRVATRDYVLRGRTIPAGEQVALFFASANRDEEVFDDPFGFRVDRSPNHHLAFGFGEHYCMGAHLARVELQTVFEHLSRRLVEYDLAGEVERLESAVNGSIKHLPIRYRLT